MGLLLPRRSPISGPVRVAPGAREAAKGPLLSRFVHPDLGIGGAERLVVDAALALKAKGHEVAMFTARHEQGHCFEETRDGSLAVHVFGDFLPRLVGARLVAYQPFT